MKLYVAQLFAFAGILAGRVASSGGDRIEWSEVARQARQAGQAFVGSGRGCFPSRQWPRAPERPRVSRYEYTAAGGKNWEPCADEQCAPDGSTVRGRPLLDILAADQS